METASEAPWRTDRPLDAARAASAIDAQFPELRPVRVAFLGEGWDFEVYQVNETWLFRFPKRLEVGDTLDREVALLERLRPELPVAIPRVEWRGRPGPSFAYGFVGYRKIGGVCADTLRLPRRAQVGLAAQLGETIAALQRIPPAELEALDLPRRSTAAEVRETLRRLPDQASAIRAAAPREIGPELAAYLEGEVEPPPPLDLPPRLAHGDLSAEHVLLDPADLAIVGLIDWSDACLAEPWSDFAGAFLWLGEAFTRAVIEHTSVAEPAAFLEHARVSARATALEALALGARTGHAPELGVGRRWTAAAFS